MSEKNIRKLLDGDSLTNNQVSNLLKRTIPLERALLCTGARYKAFFNYLIDLNTTLTRIADARGIEYCDEFEFEHKVTGAEADLLLHCIQYNTVTQHEGELKEIQRRIAPALVERMSVASDNAKHLGAFFLLLSKDIGEVIVKLIGLKKGA